MIKYPLILFFMLVSYFLLLMCFIFGTSYSKVGLETYPFNLKNYFMVPNLISDNFVLSTDTPANIGNSLPDTNDSNTFFTKGLLSSVLFPNYGNILHNINKSSTLSNNDYILNTSLYEFPKLISGTWVLNVTQGIVTNFHSAFKLVTSDGYEKHFIEINNFQNQNTSIILNPYTNTTINGYVDIKIDDQLFESHLPIEIDLNRINIIVISMDKQSISDLLFNNPIYGIVDSFKNYKNDELLNLNNP